MKILEHNAGLLSNSEVLTVVKERGADGAAGKVALPSERQAYEYLQSHSCGHKTAEQLQAFIDDTKALGLTRAEVLMFLNIAPTSPVEVHLIVEECEERLTEEQIEQLLVLVSQHLADR